MEKKLLYESLTEIGKINRALVRLLIPATPEEVYKAIVEEAKNLVGVLYGTIFLYNSKKNLFERAYSTVPITEQFTPRTKGNTYWVYNHNKPKLILREDLISHHPEVSKIVHSVLLLPLSYQKERLGVLSLKSSVETPFGKKHRESLLLFSTAASLAIRNAQLQQQQRQALETRDLFMSTASHEFKTPLTAISAYAQIAEKNIEKNKEISLNTIQGILRNSRRLNDMINSLFMASEISAGTFMTQREPLDLFIIFSQCIEDLKISSKRTIRFAANTDSIPFLGDKSKLCSVIINLIRNALAYSPEASAVEVILTVDQQKITLQVIDKGEGIKKKDLAHIFEKYFRPQHAHAGLGLGLYLCYKIVKAHNGEITIDSKVNKGTTVTVILPLQ